MNAAQVFVLSLSYCCCRGRKHSSHTFENCCRVDNPLLDKILVGSGYVDPTIVGTVVCFLSLAG